MNYEEEISFLREPEKDAEKGIMVCFIIYASLFHVKLCIKFRVGAPQAPLQFYSLIFLEKF